MPPTADQQLLLETSAFSAHRTPSPEELELMIVPKGSPLWKPAQACCLSATNDPLVQLALRSLPGLSRDQTDTLRSISAFIRCNSPDTPRVFVVAGFAGVGKTTIIGPIAEWCKQQILPFCFMAFTNSAVDAAKRRNPTILASINAKTVHSVLYGPPKRGAFPIGAPHDKGLAGAQIAILDEASLVPAAIMRDLLAVVKRRGMKLIVCGDPFQLGAVEGDEPRPFEPLLTPNVSMTQVIRQSSGSDVLHTATAIRTNAKPILPDTLLPDTLPPLSAEGAWRFPARPHATRDLLVEVLRRNPGNAIAIVASNHARVHLDAAVREQLHGLTAAPLYPHEPLIVLGNTKHQANGERIHAPAWVADAAIEEYTLKRFDPVTRRAHKERLLVFISREPDPSTNKLMKLALFPSTLAPTIHLTSLASSQQLPHATQRRLEALCDSAIPVSYYYAGTCHKAQGKEWDDVVVIPPTTLDSDTTHAARWYYTAYTRARKRLYVEDRALPAV